MDILCRFEEVENIAEVSFHYKHSSVIYFILIHCIEQHFIKVNLSLGGDTTDSMGSWKKSTYIPKWKVVFHIFIIILLQNPYLHIVIIFRVDFSATDCSTAPLKSHVLLDPNQSTVLTSSTIIMYL